MNYLLLYVFLKVPFLFILDFHEILLLLVNQFCIFIIAVIFQLLQLQFKRKLAQWDSIYILVNKLSTAVPHWKVNIKNI